MFCDLVGSTALGARVDPEEMHGVLSAYQMACTAVLQTYDGFLAQFLGDGVLAYFGYPRAHEDDAERAVRAGLDMLAAVGRLRAPDGEALTARVGIATGTVVVGEMNGPGMAQKRSVVGNALNLAERIKGVAEPGMLAVAPSTRRLLGEVFELRDLGQHALKGYAAPVKAWVVVGETPAESRFEAVRSSRLTHFVGRVRELEFLLERKTLAWQGKGHVVLVTGESGIGKSRLTRVLAERVAGEPHTRLRYQCSPYHTGSALYPFTKQIMRAATIQAGESQEQSLDKLERALAPGTTDALTVPLLAALLSIPSESRYLPVHLSAAQQRRQTFTVLLDQLELEAHRKPLLIIFEDLQWADATSLELIALAAKRIERLPVLAILTTRTKPEPAWASPPAMSTVELGRLDRMESLELVRSIAGRSLPDALVSTIVERTDGVPLFIEETTKAMLDAGVVGGRMEDLHHKGSVAPVAVPESLRDSLTERLDRLSPVKEVAQIGATIGREFPFTLLHAVAATDEPLLQSALGQLEGAGVVTSTGAGRNAIYTFRHALLQEAAYESLLKSRRLVLHSRIAEAIRDGFPEIAEKEPEVVARHFAQARLTDAAIEWWQKAGEHALRRSAYVEASSHFKAALTLAEELPADAARQRTLMRLHVAHGQALIAQRGYAAPETTAAFVRARELAAGIDDLVERLSVYCGLWAGSYIRGELAAMLEMADALLREAKKLPGTSVPVIAHRIYGTTCTFRGDFTAAGEHLEKAVATYDQPRDGPLAHRIGHDVGVAAEFYLALTLWPLGEVDRARRIAEAAFEHAGKIGHMPSVAYAHAYMCVFEAMCGNPARAAPYAEALVEFGNQHGMQWWLTSGIFFRGWTRWHAGQRQTGIIEMRQGMALCRSHGLPSASPLFHVLIAEAEAGDGRIDEALAILDELVAAIRLSGELWVEPEAQRQRGNLLLRRDPIDIAQAEAAFVAAIDAARRQKTRVFELRAALDLAGLYNDLGRRGQARDVLELALRDLPEGLRLHEVEQARNLLISVQRRDLRDGRRHRTELGGEYP
jgi:class 3 adenylate cyclase/predicted ATPase